MNAQTLLLVGSGGLAREVAAVARHSNQWQLLGFCDDDPLRQGAVIDGVPVLGPTHLVHERPNAAVLLCVGSPVRPTSRGVLADRLNLPPQRYATLVHPSAYVAPGVELGVGTIMLAGAVVTAPQRVGSHVVAMPLTVLTHDDEVSDFVTFATRVALGGGVRVDRAAYIGAGAVIRENVKIGARALVGLGSVVLNDVPPDEVWVGNPARRLRAARGGAARS